MPDNNTAGLITVYGSRGNSGINLAADTKPIESIKN